MKKIFLLSCLISLVANSQNIEKKYEFQDSLFSVSLFKKIELTENLSLKPGLTIRHKTVFNTLETPLLIEYEASRKFSTHFGLSTRTVINRTEFGLMVPHIEEPSRVFMTIGSEYQFENNTKGNFSINFPLEMNFGFKF